MPIAAERSPFFPGSQTLLTYPRKKGGKGIVGKCKMCNKVHYLQVNRPERENKSSMVEMLLRRGWVMSDDGKEGVCMFCTEKLQHKFKNGWRAKALECFTHPETNGEHQPSFILGDDDPLPGDQPLEPEVNEPPEEAEEHEPAPAPVDPRLVTAPVSSDAALRAQLKAVDLVRSFFNEDEGNWEKGYTDKRAAMESGMSLDALAKIREIIAGPLKPNESLLGLRAAVTMLDERLDREEKDIIELVTGLVRDQVKSMLAEVEQKIGLIKVDLARHEQGRR